MKQKYIIKDANEYNLIICNGKKVKGNIITIYYYPSDDNKKYFGFAVGKKLGNAVIRNKIKRKLRMIVGQNQNLFSNNYKYIIMISRDCLLYSHEKWNEDMINVVRKVINNEKN